MGLDGAHGQANADGPPSGATRVGADAYKKARQSTHLSQPKSRVLRAKTEIIPRTKTLMKRVLKKLTRHEALRASALSMSYLAITRSCRMHFELYEIWSSHKMCRSGTTSPFKV